MTDFQWVAAAIVACLSAARITRLVTHDAFPPFVRVRIWYDDLTNENEWSLLLHCQYCFGVWAAGFVVGWGYLSGLDGWWGTAWWLFNGWMSVAYMAAIIMSYDGEVDED
jgi:hypothetical protein